MGRRGEGLLNDVTSPRTGANPSPFILPAAVHTAVPCKEYTYKCRSGRCISKQNPECDGERDCEDNSDEENCSEYPGEGGTRVSWLGPLKKCLSVAERAPGVFSI